MVRKIRSAQARGLGRRDFLRATLVSAAGLLAGCRPDEPGSDAGETETGGEGPREVVDGFEYFPQSVASGDPRPDSVILWTRVEDPELAEQDVELELELAHDPEFAEPVGELARVTARAAHDHCVKVRVTDLSPGATIYYRFVHAKDGAWYASRPSEKSRACRTPPPNCIAVLLVGHLRPVNSLLAPCYAVR